MKTYKLESQYQAHVIKRLKEEYPEAIVVKEDSSYIQGLPDLLILHGDKWATLECKRSSKESHRPNQDTYVDRMNKMSFSSFIYPENEEEVFDALSKSLRPRRNSRAVQRK